MALFLVGIGLIAVAFFLYQSSKKTQHKLHQMQNYERSSVEELKQNHDYFKSNFGEGSYQHQVELKGHVTSENPLKSELAKEPCVYYRYRVTRKYETEEVTRDAHGNRTRRMVTNHDTVSENSQGIEFELKDTTGSVIISPEGATITPIKIYDNFEHGDRPSRGNWDFSFNSNSRTIGFHYVEEIIPLNTSLYVFGEANDRQGYLRVGLPKDSKENPFMISTMSEEALQKNLEGKVKTSKYGAIGLAIFGLVLIVLGALGI